MRKAILLTFSFLSLALLPDEICRRIKWTGEEFHPLIAVLQEYWGDNFDENLQFLIDVYTLWVEPNNELVKEKQIEIRQFHPFLYFWIMGIRISLQGMNESQRKELIRDQLWLAVAQPARRKMELLLQKGANNDNERQFLNWLEKNSYTLEEAIYRLISHLYRSLK